MKFGVTNYVTSIGPLEQPWVKQGVEFIFLNNTDETKFPADTLKQLDALLVWEMPITEITAAKLKPGSLVATYSIGYDDVDGDALKKHNIPLLNNPFYCTEEVADMAVGFIMASTRNIVRHNTLAKKYTTTWASNSLDSWRSRSRTVGLYGLGRIGQSVALRLEAIGFNVIFYDPYQTQGMNKVLRATKVNSLDELASQSDVVSIHALLDSETKGTINKDFLSKMKPEAILVNTARGGIIDNLDDVYNHMLANPNFRVAFDVLVDEPPKPGLLINAWRTDSEPTTGRIIITPHNAYESDQSVLDQRHDCYESAFNAIKYGRYRNIVNGYWPAGSKIG